MSAAELAVTEDAFAATSADDAPGLHAMFAPRGVVVVGASTDPGKLGGAMATALASYAAAGHAVVLVNPRGGDGMHPSVSAAVAAAAGPVDLAVLCIPAHATAEAVADCAREGVRAVLVCAGGFGETGEEGLEHEHRLREVAEVHGVHLLGPNTSGFFVPSLDLRASFVPGAADLQPGHVAVVAASGGLNHALAFALEREGAGVSVGVGIGAGVGVTAPDVLNHLATHRDTRAVALHLETVTDGPRLLEAVRALTPTTPVVALVVGEHDIGDFARSHTGALATSWRTTRALLRDAGAVLVEDETQLVTAAAALAHGRLAPGAAPGVALVTAQAGPGLLVSDALHGAGARMPELGPEARGRLSQHLPPMTYQSNPVDTGRPGPRHRQVLEAVAGDDQVDLVAVYGLAEPVVDLPGVAADAELGGIRCVVGLDGLRREVDEDRATARARGVHAVVGARALSTAVTALVVDARQRAAALGDAGGQAAATPPSHVPDQDWTEALAKEALERLGVATPRRVLCTTDAEAQSAADELGWPVAAKISDADVVHKSDHGGVHLGLSGPAALGAALEALRDIGAREVLVEQMAPPGVDLVVGARRDPVFGPVVLLGVGGIATEVYADVAVAAADSSPARFARLAEDLRARELLAGFRGGPVVDQGDLGRVCAVLAGLLRDNPHLDEVEINPLRATPEGLLALDAVFLPSTPHPHRGRSRARDHAHP